MTMKDHLDKLMQERENSVTLTADEAAERKAVLLKDAQTEVAAQLFVTKLLMTAMKSIQVYLETENEASRKYLEIIDQMHHEDVKAE